MGFTTGFTGGLTLTLGLAYLTVLAHERNRRAQCFELRVQNRVLNGLLEPATPLPPPQTRAELAQEERSSIVEAAKDRWNAEIENAIRWVQQKDWASVREDLEDKASNFIGGGLQKSRDGIEEAEKTAGPRVQEAIAASKAGARNAVHQAAVGIDHAAAATIAGADRFGAQAHEAASRIATAGSAKAHEAGAKAAEVKDAAIVKASRAAADAKSGAQQASESVKHSGGTIDTARGALRDAVQQGVEAGKDFVGRAQAAAGFAKEKIVSTGPPFSLGETSPVEAALQERYMPPRPLGSVEEAFEERYKSAKVSNQDVGVLRAV